MSKCEVAFADIHVAEEASWEALRDIAGKCDPPAKLTSFSKIEGEPMKLCVAAVRKIVSVFKDRTESDRAYIIPPAQAVPDIDQPFSIDDYLTLGGFVRRYPLAYRVYSGVGGGREIGRNRS